MCIARLTLSLQSHQLSPHKNQERITFVELLNHNRLYTSILIHMLSSTLLLLAAHILLPGPLWSFYSLQACNFGDGYNVFLKVCSQYPFWNRGQKTEMFKIYQKIDILYTKHFEIRCSWCCDLAFSHGLGALHTAILIAPSPLALNCTGKIAMTVTKVRHSHHNQSFCNFPYFWLTGINFDFHCSLQGKSQWDWEKKKK